MELTATDETVAKEELNELEVVRAENEAIVVDMDNMLLDVEEELIEEELGKEDDPDEKQVPNWFWHPAPQ